MNKQWSSDGDNQKTGFSKIRSPDKDKTLLTNPVCSIYMKIFVTVLHLITTNRNGIAKLNAAFMIPN
jgi:hypothetical protein